MSVLRKQNKRYLRDKMGILLLAAGYSRRFSTDKRRARVSDAYSLLELTISKLLESELPVRLCLRDEPGERDWRERIPNSVTPIYCDRSAQGMGATLAQGIAHCEDWSATLVALGDMPCVAPSTIRQLCEAAQETRIVAPSYRGQRGHPVVFGRRFYPDLGRLSGDSGARAVLERYASDLSLLSVQDAGVLFDVDHPQALQVLKR